MGNYAKVKAWREKQPDIKEIRAAEAKRWRAAHPDVARAIKARYMENSREERLPREAAKARERRANDPTLQKIRTQRWLDKRRGERELAAGRPTPDKCEICGEFHLRIVFDHCHIHGHFRGWICDRCNKVLGMVKDSTELLQLLVRYLGGETDNSLEKQPPEVGICTSGKALPHQ